MKQKKLFIVNKEWKKCDAFSFRNEWLCDGQQKKKTSSSSSCSRVRDRIK